MAVRTATGAGRGRLVRQLITESAVLALLGAAAGIAIGMLGIRTLLALYPEPNPTNLVGGAAIPRIGPHGAAVHLDWRVLSFVLLTSVAATVVAGVWPAWQTSRVDLQRALKETTGGAAGGSRRHRSLRSALVVIEIALALMLLIGAALLIRTS
jgi:ABC-type antimicrobial peptide transport system permease subunit